MKTITKLKYVFMCLTILSGFILCSCNKEKNNISQNSKSDISDTKEIPINVTIGGNQYDTRMDQNLIIKDVETDNKEISQLRYFKNVKHLELININISDISWIKDMNSLDYIAVYKTSVSDFSVIMI